MRSSEHLKAFEGKKSHSVLYKPEIYDHPNENVEFGLEWTGIFKDALSRQANKFVIINARQQLITYF